MTPATQRPQLVWTCLWIITFLAQFLIEQTYSAAHHSVRVVAASLQAFAIALPTILLISPLRDPWRGWRRNSLAFFAIYLLVLSTALHHVQSIRMLFSTRMPPPLYVIVYWSNVLLTSVVIPGALLMMLCFWTLAKRSRWQIFDLVAVLWGVGVIILICLQNTGTHPFDRIDSALSDVWQSLTCILLPLALTVAAVIQWGRSLRHS